MAEYKTVASTKPTKADGGDEVVLWEQDADHPGGEAFVAGPKPVQVAVTGLVEKRLREGVIAEVPSGKASKGA
jgi:hypothetical protein